MNKKNKRAKTQKSKGNGLSQSNNRIQPEPNYQTVIPHFDPNIPLTGDPYVPTNNVRRFIPSGIPFIARNRRIQPTTRFFPNTTVIDTSTIPNGDDPQSISSRDADLLIRYGYMKRANNNVYPIVNAEIVEDGDSAYFPDVFDADYISGEGIKKNKSKGIFDKYTVSQLKNMITTYKEHHTIKNYSKMKKKDLISELERYFYIKDNIIYKK